MATTSLPDRLRALADFIQDHNLPDPYLSVSLEPSASAHLDSHDDLCRWAEALGGNVRVQDVRPDEGRPFTAYVVDAPVEGWKWFTVAFYDYEHVAVPS